jgi:hypothetical protein
MKLTDLAREPQLVKITIDDTDIVEQYGESIEFWTWDRQPMDVFLRLANRQDDDRNGIFDLVRTLILDEAGQEIITEQRSLPAGVMMRVLTRVVEQVGK